MPRNFLLIAGHNVSGKRDCCEQVFGNVLVRCREGGMSDSPNLCMGCELHKCFLVFSLSWDEMARGRWSWVFSSPRSVRL